jgi:hypothetical protein
MIAELVAGGLFTAARIAGEGCSFLRRCPRSRFELVCAAGPEDLAMNDMRGFVACSILTAWLCSAAPSYASRPPIPRVPSPEEQSEALGLAALIGKRLSVSENRTVFTLFALLNVAGYDEENNSQGMHAVRKRVRERLARVTPSPLRQRLQAYYRQHSKAATNHSYTAVALATSGPPGFTPTQSFAEITAESPYRELKGLPGLLREFHANVPADSLYEDVRGEYQAYAGRYLTAVRDEVLKVMNYCRVSNSNELAGGGELKHAVVIPNLLDSHHCAFSLVLDDTFYSVEGPQTQLGYNPHEFIHSTTNPMTYNSSYQDEQKRALPVFDAVKDLPDIRSTYGTLQSFLDECLVKAIELKYLDTGDAKRSERLRSAMMTSYRKGYILTRYFYEQLALYDQTYKPLREFYPEMLRRLDGGKELARWKHENGTER